MTIEDYLEIVAALNQENSRNSNISKIPLESEDICLLTDSQRFFFVSEFSDNLPTIESIILKSELLQTYSERKPNNSYLILLYNVEMVTEEISKQIIELEENAYFYKKYVLYYTNSEIEAFMHWWKSLQSKNLLDILNTESLSPNSNDEATNFLFRLIIKTPFIHLQFPKNILIDFDEKVKEKVLSYNDENIQELHVKYSTDISLFLAGEQNTTGDMFVKNFVEALIKETVEGDG